EQNKVSAPQARASWHPTAHYALGTSCPRQKLRRPDRCPPLSQLGNPPTLSSLSFFSPLLPSLSNLPRFLRFKLSPVPPVSLDAEDLTFLSASIEKISISQRKASGLGAQTH